MRVLIVEDYPDSAEALAHLVRLWGHQVEVATDGHEALAAVERTIPNVILLDLGLPRIDGYEVARRLRADRRFDSTLIVAVTGFNEPRDRERSRQVGIAHHLSKPVDITTLELLLARHAAGEDEGQSSVVA
jgi:CheY-like chemotaxis protein